MQYMPITASMFLIGETREQPMHVGGLQLFIPREGQTAGELADDMMDAFALATDIQSDFRKRPTKPFSLLGSVSWSYDDEIDFDYHVRRIALPKPGRVRELLHYVSLNHSTLLDRNKPMWEAHLIEGLADGRLALYTKIHHSVVDGVTALRILGRTLSADPEDRNGKAFWDAALKKKRPPKPKSGVAQQITGAISGVADVANQVVGMAPASARIALRAVTDPNYLSPTHGAPKTILDVPIGSARRFAAQQWETARLQAVAKALDITLNDVVLAMCGGALRNYLIEQDALPDAPLLAAVPVSMHTGDGKDGNAVSAILANLATDQPDPTKRLAQLTASTKASKEVIRGLSPLQALALGAANASSMAFMTIPGVVEFAPSQFNIIISNVPGPQHDLYWNGAQLDGLYPVSIPSSGCALNITITSAAKYMGFGLIGARAEVPSLQRLLTHLDTALGELEKVAEIT
ncbi:wax ester/triacylglycerol synthase family O-acyltransferase [Gordonia sp. TBRC 11910]|uniref:Diacylglycerol O-acyltransferase n=1 Tax=Gordonia asplenii TaxID=2725283 RepID=A0A848KWB4_9ACTN|nr:wax ester/triacylglycerol synthase family O-acyltransferase [Gordonia asplenii]NMO02880.1 wax ester/triacylglycerol synthase family O-acyltransferase [Gordonia asplenii]